MTGTSPPKTAFSSHPPTHPILRLQRAMGNQGVQRCIQAKLIVGAANNEFEAEADRVAHQVIKMPAAPSPATGETSVRQRTSEENETSQMKPFGASIAPEIHHLPSDSRGSFKADPAFEKRLSTIDEGRPLSASTRAFMEPRFGADFTGVRLHTGSESARLNRAINARAFTHGPDIFLAAGENDVESTAGKELLAHELTHTIQQASGSVRRAHEPGTVPRNDSKNSYEVLAPRAVAGDVSATGNDKATPFSLFRIPPRSSKATIQRQAAAAEKLDADYQDALTHSLWSKATEYLNGFNNTDIKNRVALLTPDQRQAMRLAVPGWNFRVRAALLDLDYQEAVARTDWIQAAIHLNGFNDADNDERLGRLPRGQAANLAAGAMLGMQGISQQRIVDAAERLQRKLEAAGGALGTAVIGEVIRLQQQGANIATARAAAFQQFKLVVRSDPAGASPTQEDRQSAVTKIAAAMAGGVVTEPGMLLEGKVAHLEIGMYYASLNPPTLVDPSLIAVIRALKLTKAAYDQLYARLPEELLESLAVRPDILDLGKMQLYEIKSVDSGSRAAPEMRDYIELLESFRIPGLPASAFTFHPGSPGNSGTTGFLPSPKGWIIFCCPVPGVIIYRTVMIVENPRHALERLKTELQGSHSLMSGVGVESVTAISVALVMGFEEMIPLLISAARAAGQAIPEVAKSWPNLPKATGQLNVAH